MSVCVNILWWVASARHLYRVAAEPGEAAQLCVFILDIQYLYLGVLKPAFGYRCVVCVLVTKQLLFVLSHCVPPRNHAHSAPAESSRCVTEMQRTEALATPSADRGSISFCGLPKQDVAPRCGRKNAFGVATR